MLYAYWLSQCVQTLIHIGFNLRLYFNTRYLKVGCKLILFLIEMSEAVIILVQTTIIIGSEPPGKRTMVQIP